MKPAKFTYHAPTTLEEAFGILETHGDDAKIIAGGQSLVPVMNLRLAQPDHLVDINGVAGLSDIAEDAERLVIGATTRHEDILSSPLVQARCPILAEAGRRIGHLAIRTRGTIGGSLSHADPAAEWALMAFLLDARITIRSRRGSRTADADSFIQSIYATDLEPDEILVSVSFTCLAAGEGWSVQDLCRRAGDFAIVAVAATLSLGADGTVAGLRLALGGMDATPIRLRDVESAAIGRHPDADWITSVAAEAAQAGSPEGDLHASAAYRRDICPVLVTRALREALARAKGDA